MLQEVAALEEQLSQDDLDENDHDDDDECPKWTEKDTLLFQPCLGLIKVMSHLLLTIGSKSLQKWM